MVALMRVWIRLCILRSLDACICFNLLYKWVAGPHMVTQSCGNAYRRVCRRLLHHHDLKIKLYSLSYQYCAYSAYSAYRSSPNPRIQEDYGPSALRQIWQRTI